LLVDELIEEKLSQLEASVRERKQSPGGTAELRRRVKAFGECHRSEAETTGRYFERLRHWLDRPIPQSKSPLHPPRQNRR
jgi:hypothetical protein